MPHSLFSNGMIPLRLDNVTLYDFRTWLIQDTSATLPHFPPIEIFIKYFDVALSVWVNM